MKTQLVYCIVFCTRYVDLLFHYISLYNTLMKLFFIGSSVYIVYLMKYRYNSTYESMSDNFKTEYLLGLSAFLALLFHVSFTPYEILWAFSIYLEAVAVLPQLFMMSRTGEAETITTHYLFALGGYRAMYLLNWIWRYAATGHTDWIAWIAGLVQTGLYADFFHIYFTKYVFNVSLTL